eukprot:scaffold306_cov525-Prasinococcus_capsulatus_cf.AAC.20
MFQEGIHFREHDVAHTVQYDHSGVFCMVLVVRSNLHIFRGYTVGSSSGPVLRKQGERYRSPSKG